MGTGWDFKEVKIGMEKMGARFLGEEAEGRLTGMLSSDKLTVCGESEKNVINDRTFKNLGLKVSADMIEVIGIKRGGRTDL